MPPQPNVERRQALADAAIEVLGRSGVHGLSHRTVDERAGLPPGTTSNYFRSRDALLKAAARRVVELHEAEMRATNARSPVPPGPGDLVELIALSLYVSATEHRDRYLAIYELSLEATRRPALQETLDRMGRATLDFTVGQHRALGLPTSPEQVQTLMTLFGGALFTLVTRPPADVSPQTARTLARAALTGALNDAGGGPPA
ncbi:TetR/AcrR family transcriptional regulator [Actinoallomurus sp. CA-142502]|uniref:TetR/AcrR family transcriptional regulator n=1 Tax=Actinoallomurus sp. CA-142502 TaxID=3239885 RepID=UPI003D927B9E